MHPQGPEIANVSDFSGEIAAIPVAGGVARQGVGAQIATDECPNLLGADCSLEASGWHRCRKSLFLKHLRQLLEFSS